MSRNNYPDDLTNEEWERIKDFTEIKHTKRDRKPKWTKREMMNAIFYMMRGNLPEGICSMIFLPGKVSTHNIRTWKIQGIFEKIHHFIREELRQLFGRNKEATVPSLIADQ